MKTLKRHVFIMTALIALLGLTACETDEEKGYDISGLYGKTWFGDLGFSDSWGEALYSYITFSSGAYSDHGVGTDEQYYYDGSLYQIYKFDWEIDNGLLCIYYSDGYELVIRNPYVVGNWFRGTIEEYGTSFDFELEWVSGRSVPAE